MFFMGFNLKNFEYLWVWMDKECVKGVEVLVILYNVNMSNGVMYNMFNGNFIIVDYVESCFCNEFINEVV